MLVQKLFSHPTVYDEKNVTRANILSKVAVLPSGKKK